LGRRIKDEVKENPDQYSIIYVPNPFIVPSSNCREYRYWESFWIIRGLLQCGMHQTARGMIDNYLELVQQYGFVPGCGPNTPALHHSARRTTLIAVLK